MASVVFNYANFLARYPEFTGTSEATLSLYFGDATLYLNNGDASPVQNIVDRTRLLYMLVAHIAALGNRPVGRVTSGSEGSVSASFEYNAPGSAAWFAQTQYGAAYWQATLRYRSFRYIA